MAERLKHELMADLLQIPSVKLIDKTVLCQNALEKQDAEAAALLEKFLNFLFDSPMYRIEEAYFKSPHIHTEPLLDELCANFHNARAEQRGSSRRRFLEAIRSKDDAEEIAGRLAIPALTLIVNRFRTACAEPSVYRFAFQALLKSFEKERRPGSSPAFHINPLIGTASNQSRAIGYENMWICRN